jgi:hypothetical protein
MGPGTMALKKKPQFTEIVKSNTCENHLKPFVIIPCLDYVSLKTLWQDEPLWATAKKHNVSFSAYLWGRCDIPFDAEKRLRQKLPALFLILICIFDSFNDSCNDH